MSLIRLLMAGAMIVSAMGGHVAGAQEPTPVLKIAFRSARSDDPHRTDLWMMNPDGSKPEPLDRTRIVEAYPATRSHAPRKGSDLEVVAEAAEKGAKEIYLKNRRDGTSKRLTANDSDDSSPKVSPCGKYVYFHARTVGGKFQLRRVSIEGKDEMPIVADGYSGQHLWSPDGKRIAFVWTGADGYEIRLIRPDGSERKTLPYGDPENPRRESVRLMAWSPDGKRILCVTGVGGPLALVCVKTDGRGAVELARPRVRMMFPDCAWSPDSAQVAFTSTGAVGSDLPGGVGSNANEEIFLVNADGSGMKKLTDHWKDDGDPQFVLVK